MAEPALLEARGIFRRYGRTTLLSGVDVTLHAGEVLLILGANGAGKSTLLRTLAGLARPDAGTVQVAGEGVTRSRGRIGYLAHESLLYDDLTVGENLEFTARLHGGVSAAQVTRAIERAALVGQRDRLVRQLSRGQRQRAAIARSLLHGPEVLLLDEPYTGLDTESVAELTRFLQQSVAKGRGVVMVGHHPEEGWDAVTRIGVLARGRWSYEGPRPAAPSDARRIYAEALRG